MNASFRRRILDCYCTLMEVRHRLVEGELATTPEMLNSLDVTLEGLIVLSLSSCQGSDFQDAPTPVESIGNLIGKL